MVLIRPLIRANASPAQHTHRHLFYLRRFQLRRLLTPLGDPPLFLGYQKGVPFTWTLQLWPMWLFVNLSLLVIFNVFDQIVLNREEKDRPGSQLKTHATRTAQNPRVAQSVFSCRNRFDNFRQRGRRGDDMYREIAERSLVASNVERTEMSSTALELARWPCTS